ncbi:helix-turn-helix transcriptional regulator [Dietzia natronolimnaea]|uniref:helix-turn-helix transcriptional regulator n=1 Tax=Dietzia natronolimnaea TaxID=161920 RepID=UPI0015FB9D98|nr:helix-turn-helix domain-containing protein [Dietzia natronolimnaea]MBB1036721.1 helix-turn-helix domain-containing protein [Dietzia natronolimnaea]
MKPDARVPELWTPEQTAEYLHTTPASLRLMRYRRTGPDFVKAGPRVLYRVDDVVAWLQEGAA